ncbi:NADH dehydrogenase ubiquinone 1 alpha subcomplex subunit 2 [Hondaea fermentalgiana]|uniref:Large ribosomal subunit protein mL43 n=1 Tax=Hondaea fermentalgiana TaxID=2315210 RepID=A0A2R5GKI8_9STRA|nr:NADH dehydrogenase ubiquinone 1 alpha subcomplex subunit 2 [Hondaea fermentalgiana]|eukprot:GBG31390.1 NADH dehydrogenase ubiquinone 1 alpha subcomplex subunit 2 [Hondaea fermentalgiana]
MTTRGVWHLQRLTVRYCQHGGSSIGTRQFIRQLLPEFAENNPQLTIDVVHHANKHPVVLGEYRGVDPKTVDLRKKTADEVLKVFTELRNQKGHKVTKIKSPIYSKNPSVQGEWRPGVATKMDFTIKDLD